MKKQHTLGMSFTIACAMLASSAAVLHGTAMAEQAKEKNGEPVFAFVALKKLAIPTAEQVHAGLEAALGKDTKIEGIEIDDKSVAFTIDGQQAMYGFMDFPIPWKDLELPCRA
jgi:hypothetical protein